MATFGQPPVLETAEVPPEAGHRVRIEKVDEGIAPGDFLLEAKQYVKKVEAAGEALPCEQVDQAPPRETFWKVAQHHRSPLFGAPILHCR